MLLATVAAVVAEAASGSTAEGANKNPFNVFCARVKLTPDSPTPPLVDLDISLAFTATDNSDAPILFPAPLLPIPSKPFNKTPAAAEVAADPPSLAPGPASTAIAVFRPAPPSTPAAPSIDLVA